MDRGRAPASVQTFLVGVVGARGGGGGGGGCGGEVGVVRVGALGAALGARILERGLQIGFGLTVGHLARPASVVGTNSRDHAFGGCTLFGRSREQKLGIVIGREEVAPVSRSEGIRTDATAQKTRFGIRSCRGRFAGGEIRGQDPVQEGRGGGQYEPVGGEPDGAADENDIGEVIAVEELEAVFFAVHRWVGGRAGQWGFRRAERFL